MRLPIATPNRSPFALRFLISLLLILGHSSRLTPYYTHAAELDLVSHRDHNHHRLLHEPFAYGQAGRTTEEQVNEGLRPKNDATHEGELAEYEAEFLGLDRGITGRALDGQTSLENNQPNNLNINPEDANHYVFPNSSVWGQYSPRPKGLPSALKNWSTGSEWLGGGGDLTVTGQDGLGVGEQGVQALEQKQNETVLSSRTVYISINTCLQPFTNTITDQEPPQLTVYISTDNKNKKPGPTTGDLNQVAVTLDEGFASIAFNTSGDVYISVSAQKLSGTPFAGSWNYEIAASIDGPYHMHNKQVPFLYLVDSDRDNALLVTDNLTEANASDQVFHDWLDLEAPFMMFAHNDNNTAISGLTKSFCGLRNNAQIIANRDSSDNGNVEMGIVTRGLGNKPKEQFYVKGLNASSTYYSILGMRGNSTAFGPGVVGGGGQVWQPTKFKTKADGNCRVIYNLPFCSEVAYAVPSNPTTYPSLSDLSSFYDNLAAAHYKNFTYSLQQIPCNTTSSAQYSLARNCSDCAHDYKNWLCAVSIPRCEDFSSTLPYRQPRNVAQQFLNGSLPDPANPETNLTLQGRLYANSSRNAVIDRVVRPGPYKEVLPCEDLCYSLVQSCPAALQFACPLPGKGLERSYGRRSGEGELPCNYLGVVYVRNGGGGGVREGMKRPRWVCVTLVVGAFLGLL